MKYFIKIKSPPTQTWPVFPQRSLQISEIFFSGSFQVDQIGLVRVGLVQREEESLWSLAGLLALISLQYQSVENNQLLV